MKILVTGATGLVGSALVAELARGGHTVCRLVRPQSQAEGGAAGSFDVAWNPETGELGGAAVGADAVVNLAGASIADGRWTEERKRVLRSSRVDATRSLVGAVGKMNAKPAVWINASAIGIYGDRGEEILDEASAPGGDFLAGLARDWEAEAQRAEAFRTRIVLMRFGIILAKDGGALKTMMQPFRLGLGGRLGSGKQWMSWVALEDVVRILQGALENSLLRGAVNVVAPEPVTNAVFTEKLAEAMKRPAIFAAPAFALKVALGGEKAQSLLLGSQRVMPGALSSAGYEFREAKLGPALARMLG